VIYDCCNTNRHSNAYFPVAYNREDIGKIVQIQQSCTDFYGATVNHNFLVLEYEDGQNHDQQSVLKIR
jgi:hypothetical protein